MRYGHASPTQLLSSCHQHDEDKIILLVYSLALTAQAGQEVGEKVKQKEHFQGFIQGNHRRGLGTRGREAICRNHLMMKLLLRSIKWPKDSEQEDIFNLLEARENDWGPPNELVISSYRGIMGWLFCCSSLCLAF